MNPIILARIEDLLIREMGLDPEINADNRLTEDLGLDALDRLHFICALEEEFEICITERAGDSLITVRDAARAVDQLLNDEVHQ